VIVCPVCGFELRAELRGQTLELRFEYGEWHACCNAGGRGDPFYCQALRPAILERLAQVGANLDVGWSDSKHSGEDREK
jgi:hypothetical protein